MASLKRVISLLPVYRIKHRLHSCKTLSSSPRSALNYLTYSQSLKTYYCQSIRCLFSATYTIRCASNNDNMASGMTEVRNLDYKSLIDRKSKGGKLIDVREKKELEEDGTIPNSYNIPVGELSSALAMGNDAFKAKYGFEKPDVSDELIFSCRSGKRSLMAYSAAEKAGYKNIYNYAGGWLDWAKNSGS